MCLYARAHAMQCSAVQHSSEACARDGAKPPERFTSHSEQVVQVSGPLKCAPGKHAEQEYWGPHRAHHHARACELGGGGRVFAFGREFRCWIVFCAREYSMLSPRARPVHQPAERLGARNNEANRHVRPSGQLAGGLDCVAAAWQAGSLARWLARSLARLGATSLAGICKQEALRALGARMGIRRRQREISGRIWNCKQLGQMRTRSLAACYLRPVHGEGDHNHYVAHNCGQIEYGHDDDHHN